MVHRCSGVRVSWMLWSLLLCITAATSADRLVLIPSAYNLPPGSLKVEVARRETQGGLTLYWLRVGLVGGFELEGTRYETQQRQRESFSLQYNILPDIGFTPAVSVGVRDVANQTEEGIAFYIAAAYRLPYMPPNPIIDEMFVFGGVGAGGIKGPFVGAKVRTPYRILLSAEYDSRQWNAALAWEPVPLLQLHLYSIGGKTYYGASLAVSF